MRSVFTRVAADTAYAVPVHVTLALPHVKCASELALATTSAAAECADSAPILSAHIAVSSTVPSFLLGRSVEIVRAAVG